MFTISYNTVNGKTKTYHIADESLAYFYFSKLIQAIDMWEVTMIDGLNGEVITQWQNGKMRYINGIEI